MITSPVSDVTKCIIQLKDQPCSKTEAWGLYQRLVDWIELPDHPDYAEAVLLTSFFARALYEARVFEYDDLLKVPRKAVNVKGEPEPPLQLFKNISDAEMIPLCEKVVCHLSTCSDEHCMWFTTVFSLIDAIRERCLANEDAIEILRHRAFQVIVKHQDHALDEDATSFMEHLGFQIQSLEERNWHVDASPVNDALELLIQLKESWENVKGRGLHLCGQLTYWISIPARADYHEAATLLFILARALLNKEMISEKRYNIVVEKAAQRVLTAMQSKLDFGLYELILENGFEIVPFPPPRQMIQPRGRDFESLMQWLSAYDGENDRVEFAKEAFRLAQDDISFFRVFFLTVIKHDLSPETLGIQDRVNDFSMWSWIFTFSNHSESELQEQSDQRNAFGASLFEE